MLRRRRGVVSLKKREMESVGVGVRQRGNEERKGGEEKEVERGAAAVGEEEILSLIVRLFILL